MTDHTTATVTENTRIRLVASDMDGTLLDGDRQLPDDAGPLLRDLHGAGMYFVPASGRSWRSLDDLFRPVHSTDDERPAPTYIADNGACIVHNGQTIATHSLDQDLIAELIQAIRTYAQQHDRDIVTVLCSPDMAYVDHPEGPQLDEAASYYTALTRVENLLVVQDRIIKVAIADLSGIDDFASDVLEHFADRAQVVRSGQVWADVMPTGVTKGSALRWLQDNLGISRHETAAFGDHLNDIEMLHEAEHSYAVANALPEVLEAAQLRAPANTAGGVLTVLRDLIARQPADDRHD